MNTDKVNIPNNAILELAVVVAVLLLKLIGLDPTKNPKAQKYIALNIKPRLARNIRKDRVDKIRIGTTTGYKKYRPTGEISELKLGIAVADFVCDQYALPLKEHPSLLSEYNNLVIFYESLFGKCCEPQAIGNLLSGRIAARRKKKSTTEETRPEHKAIEFKTHSADKSEEPNHKNPTADSETHPLHDRKGVQLQSEDVQPKPEFDFDKNPE